MRYPTLMAVMLCIAASTLACTTREALIGTGAAVGGAALGYYAGNNYDVDVDHRNDDHHDDDHSHDHDDHR